MRDLATHTRAEMPFTEHLRELRSRILHSLAAITVMTLLCYNWSAEIFSFVTAPLASSFANAKLIGTGPADAFLCEIHVAIAGGIVFSSPYWFMQIWRFIEPGLNDRERRFAIPFIFCSTVFFIGGVVFCFKVALPAAFDYFSGRFEAMKIGPDLRIAEYLSFVIKMALVFGIVFELPIVSYFMARLGMLSHTWLLRNFRYAILIIFVLAALLTPPDVVSQLLLAGPLVVIYLLSVGVCYLSYPRTPPSA